MSVVKLATTQVNQDVVDLLEKELERAKKGEVQGIGIAAVNSDYSFTTAYETGDNLTLIGAVSVLNHKICENEG